MSELAYRNGGGVDETVSQLWWSTEVSLSISLYIHIYLYIYLYTHIGHSVGGRSCVCVGG